MHHAVLPKCPGWYVVSLFPACRKLDNMELSFFNNSRSVEMVQSFLQKGALHDMSFLQVRADLLHVFKTSPGLLC